MRSFVVPASLPEGYLAEVRASAGLMLRAASGLGALAFVVMFPVDPMLTAGDDLASARLLRVVAIAVLLLLFGASFNTAWSTRWGRPATLFCCLVTGGTVAGLAYLTGGTVSDYHEALYLTLFGYALLPAPWQRYDAPVAFALIFAFYDLLLIAGDRAEPWGHFATHNTLLGASVLVAIVLDRILTRGRVDAFVQREALAAANARLTALDEAKSRFFANISHELRTPLTLTIAPLDALLDGSREVLTDGQREKLLLAQRNALRLLRMVDDLLALTKAEAASLRLHAEPLDLGDLVHTFVADVAGLTARKRITLDVHVDPELPLLDGDRHLIERVLLNLVGNAAKFTNEGGRITVSAVGEDDGVALTVTDDGVGIGPADLPHIFDRFYQADSGTTRRVGGTGIGLALVREIVELHGGGITAESALGEGTLIRVWLPRQRAADAEQLLSPALTPSGDVIEVVSGLPEWHEAIRSANSYRFQGIDDATERRIAPRPRPKGHAPTVLVVEDNPDMIRFLVALLASDYNVLSAQNGRAGLRLATERRPDLIISDVMMPELSGFEMLELLRAQPGTAAIPLIFLTARGAAEDRVAGRAGGAETYLAKPFRSSELLAAVDALLDHQHIAQTTSAHQHDESLVFMASGVREVLDLATARLDAALAVLANGGSLELELGRDTLVELARELHDFASAGTAPVTEPALLHATIRAAVATLSEHSHDRTVHVNVAAETAVALTSSELTAAVTALLERAVAVTPPNGNIFVQAGPSRDGHVALTIRDEGPRIPVDDVERVFFAFYGPIDGSGARLGLTFHRRVIQARGGTLGIEQVGGANPAFVMRLPLHPGVSGGEPS